MKSMVGTADYQKVIKKAEEFFKRSGVPRMFPIDVEQAATNLGIQMIQKPLKGDVSGFLFIDKSGPILGVNSRHGSPRQRFTVAHEIGHFLLHVPKDTPASFIDKEILILNRDSRSQQGIVAEEIEANFFAAEILMPAEILYREVTTSSTGVASAEWCKQLARKFNVSDDAMRFRLSNLGFVRF